MYLCAALGVFRQNGLLRIKLSYIVSGQKLEKHCDLFLAGDNRRCSGRVFGVFWFSWGKVVFEKYFWASSFNVKYNLINVAVFCSQIEICPFAFQSCGRA